VVNEVVSDSGEFTDGLRRSEWYRILGEEFIDLAFQYADESFNAAFAAEGADRPVTLFINDYNTEQGGKQDRYAALIDRLLARDVPLDGVGHQFHVSLAMPIAALEGALDRFADRPVTQAVTEFDVTTGTPVTEAKLIDQGYYYRDAFRVFRAHADDLYSVTMWGLTDGRSWRVDSGAPLLFDDGFQAKPAYYGAVDSDELPAPLRTANVFRGDVALDAAATGSLEWQKLPLIPIEQAAGFQLRWEADHLTVFVSVDDPDAEASDAVTFRVGDAAYTVARDGSGDAGAVVTERDGGYDMVAHLPLPAAAEGGTVLFDVRVSDGGTTAGWNAEGVSGTLTFIEALSYTEVVETAGAPEIDGAVDAGWAAANPLTTDKQIEGTGGATATIRTLWRENTLYVLAEVADPTVDVSGSDPWIQDSVEIFVDAGNYKNGSYRYDDTQIRISATNVVSFGTGDEAFQQNRVTSATATVGGGYVVEAAISLLEEGGVGTFHGLDFQVNDATFGARTGIRAWADPTGTGYQSTARWGVGQLVAAPAPVEKADSTVFGLPHTFIARRGTPIGYTAIVLSEGPAPTGTVTVYDRGTPVATATLPAGSRIASATIPGLTRGIHFLSVEYSGSDLVEGSTSFPLPVLVF
jgi:endo-1,4-beta-xylanase